MQQPSETVSVTLAPTQRTSQSGSGYSVVVLLTVVGAVVVVVEIIEVVELVVVVVVLIQDWQQYPTSSQPFSETLPLHSPSAEQKK